ncbi:valyl-tRNA synthetase [Microbacterium sp. W4I20]|nr:valyl-tRNA synthetase [Microbacterium sp. W4I20]
MLRSTLEDDRTPWRNAAISGFIVDPDRKKMSKSKGNVVTPADVLDNHGSDAVRYWAASSRLGMDAAFDPQNPTQVKIGRRLAIKVLNAAKFVLSFPVPEGAEVTRALDASMLTALDGVVVEATKAFERYDAARALELTEAFFWTFCDDYLELVKERAYDRTDAGQASAALSLRLALSTLLRLLAPVISFATEEVWSWFEEGSVHNAAWPEPLGVEGDAAVLSVASEALIGIRRAKTEAKASQKTPVSRAVIAAPAAKLDALRAAADDLRAVGRIAEIEFVEAEEFAVTAIEFAPTEDA